MMTPPDEQSDAGLLLLGGKSRIFEKRIVSIGVSQVTAEVFWITTVGYRSMRECSPLPRLRWPLFSALLLLPRHPARPLDDVILKLGVGHIDFGELHAAFHRDAGGVNGIRVAGD